MKKKSVKKSARSFIDAVAEIERFVDDTSGLSDKYVSWCHDYAVIRLYTEFESLMLSALTGAINNDTATSSATVGVRLPKHLTDEVCEFLILGTGYFDFNGRSGLISTLKRFVPESHYLVRIVKKTTYEDALDRLVALRNFAAHSGERARLKVLEAVDQKRVGASGSWLKRQGRLSAIMDRLGALAAEIETAAPF